jgi:Predicted CDP-diglyceride synthetase/phosphatidate cytidylyltransferase|nr:MAG: CDP-archaeol synthase [Pseudomonadota bacterium]
MGTFTFVDLDALILLVVANATPVLLAMLLGDRWARPIDGGRILRDGRPLFGSHKTWRGLAGGILASGAAGAVLSVGFVTGALFGMLALAGDLVSSFAKRRLDRASGRETPLLDQLPESLLPMLLLRGPLDLDALTVAGTAAVFTLLDLLASRLRAGIHTPARGASAGASSRKLLNRLPLFRRRPQQPAGNRPRPSPDAAARCRCASGEPHAGRTGCSGPAEPTPTFPPGPAP